MTDYRDYYNLETYLLGPVRSRFQQDGHLSAVDFFCIVIWKANRAKSIVAKKLLSNCETLDEAVLKLTKEISNGSTPESKMRVLIEKWGFRLPMASAILTILYPDEFTVYDVRVAGTLDDGNSKELSGLVNRAQFRSLWSGYVEFIDAVKKSTPSDLPCLRDRDRWLWGKSFFLQLEDDVRARFLKANPEDLDAGEPQK